MVSLIYEYKYKKENNSLLKGCVLAWRVYQQKKKLLIQQEESYTLIKNSELVGGILKRWRSLDRVKGRALFTKLSKFVYPSMQDSLTQIFKYAQKEELLEPLYKGYTYERKIESKRQHFISWIILLQQKEQMRLLEQSRKQYLLKKALRAFDSNRLNQLQQKYQMLRIIQFFGDRKPETLVGFSQAFLILNSEYCEENRLCSTALAKYVIEKWRNQLTELRDKRLIREQAQEYYAFNLAKQTLFNLKQGIEISKNRQVYRDTIDKFYSVRIVAKSFESFKMFRGMREKQGKLNRIQHEVLKQKCKQMFKKVFQVWYVRAQEKCGEREVVEEIQERQRMRIMSEYFQKYRGYFLRHNQIKTYYEEARSVMNQKRIEQTLYTYFQAFRETVFRKKEQRIQKQQANDDAYGIYYYKLANKVLTQLKIVNKDQAQKKKYSKLYTIFVAWKFMIKEKVLLKKYLDECNYKTENLAKTKTSQRRRRSKENMENSYKTMEEKHKRQNSKENVFTPTLQMPLNQQKPKGILKQNINTVNSGQSSNEDTQRLYSFRNHL